MRTYVSSVLCFIICEHSKFKTKIESKYRWGITSLEKSQTKELKRRSGSVYYFFFFLFENKIIYYKE